MEGRFVRVFGHVETVTYDHAYVVGRFYQIALSLAQFNAEQAVTVHLFFLLMEKIQLFEIGILLLD